MKDIRIIVLSGNQKDVLSKLWEKHGGTRQSFSLALIGLMIIPDKMDWLTWLELEAHRFGFRTLRGILKIHGKNQVLSGWFL